MSKHTLVVQGVELNSQRDICPEAGHTVLVYIVLGTSYADLEAIMHRVEWGICILKLQHMGIGVWASVRGCLLVQ